MSSNQVSMTFRGARRPPSQWALLRMAACLLRREYLLIPRKGGWMCLEESGWDRSFLCASSIQEAVVPLMPFCSEPP